ncbi:PRC-barrel domain containing protein [Croceibacterium ferulae]|uniref:PRC-barrel domain containing protein n=1 Tax=Croceibacterium ferulae TaxID=1854641 RepID=UPI000EB4369E|nr:PRC-barrel domain containing protein [Croceibacterium ferulae]
MKFVTLAALSSLALGVAACQSEAEKQADATEDALEQRADAGVAAADGSAVALGMTERQLLDADLVSANGTELGEVQALRRTGDQVSGEVTGLIVELENSNPDRYVTVPLQGLTTRKDGNDMDVQTALTAAELAAMPDVQLPTT